METKHTHLTLHQGQDYAVIMRPGETTGSALVEVKYPGSEDMALLRMFAAAPDLLAALIRLRDCPDVQMDSTEPETDAAREQASAAIARATNTNP